MTVHRRAGRCVVTTLEGQMEMMNKTHPSPNSLRWDIRCVRRRCRLLHLAAHPRGAWAPVAPAMPSRTLRVTVIWWCLGSSWSPGRPDGPCSSITTLLWLRTSLSATTPSQSSPGQNTHVFVPGQTESVLQLILKLSTCYRFSLQ